MSSRGELVRRLIAYRAATKAIEEALKTEGELEHRENETVSTHRLAVGTVTGSQTQDHVEVTNPEAFLAYLAGAHPDEVKTVQVQVVRNPDWLAQVKDALARLARVEYDLAPDEERKKKPFPVNDAQGTIIPGLAFEPGGRYITTSITPTTTARRNAAAAARFAIATGNWAAVEEAARSKDFLTREHEDE